MPAAIALNTPRLAPGLRRFIGVAPPAVTHSGAKVAIDGAGRSASAAASSAAIASAVVRLEAGGRDASAAAGTPGWTSDGWGATVALGSDSALGGATTAGGASTSPPPRSRKYLGRLKTIGGRHRMQGLSAEASTRERLA